eukprot:2126322-Amphidinium_carterae.2
MHLGSSKSHFEGVLADVRTASPGSPIENAPTRQGAPSLGWAQENELHHQAKQADKINGVHSPTPPSTQARDHPTARGHTHHKQPD